MITPLVYEVHDDNDPRHIYMHDSVRGSIDKLSTNVELYSLKWYITKYVPLFILNLLNVDVAITQSLTYKIKFTIRVNVSRIIHIVVLPRHINQVVNTNLNNYIQMMRKGYK
jgi:hypothetical protein